MSNQVLARKMADLVRHQLAGALKAPALHRLDLSVTVSDDAATASVGWQGTCGAHITLPVKFCDTDVEADTTLYLGLLSHEVGHLPDLQEGRKLLERAQQEGGDTLRTAFNFVEDARMESTLLDEPVNLWLTHTRELVGANLNPRPETLWDFLMWVRFGNPAVPLNATVPATLSGWREDFLRGLLWILRKHLPNGIGGAYQAAKEILQLAKDLGIPIPPPPPEMTAVTGNDPQGEVGEPISAEPEIKLPGMGGGYPEWESPDTAALEEGQRLAWQLRSWWTQSRVRHIAGGVGKYNPRLEASGIPPFTLPLVKQTAPPPKLAIFLDISDSMWGGSRRTAMRLHLARIAMVAIATAAKAAGGQVRIWAFDANDQALYLGDDLKRACSVRGYGTTVNFLETVAPKLAGWSYLFVTDAQVGGVPGIWDAARRRDAAVILISDDGDDATAAKRLGDRVLQVTDIHNLPHLTALAARRFFGTASRA